VNQDFAVQLVHRTSETSGEDHGFVRVKSDDGQLLSEIADYQHNRCLGEPWENTRMILLEVLAKHPSVRQPSAELAAKGWPSIPPGKQLNRRQRMTLMASQGNVSMRQTPKESVQRPSCRPASLVRSGSSVSAFANNGQQVLQYRRRSNSTTR